MNPCCKQTKEYTFEELFRKGIRLFPNLSREEYFKKKFVEKEAVEQTKEDLLKDEIDFLESYKQFSDGIVLGMMEDRILKLKQKLSEVKQNGM